MRFTQKKIVKIETSGLKAIAACAALMVATSLGSGAFAAAKSINSEVGGLFIPTSRSELVIVPSDIAEVIVADPDIADVHVIGAKRVAFIGKKIGRTNAKLFDKDNHVIRQFDVVVGYDLPAIRKALHTFLPHEHIGVELVNTNIALTGEVSDGSAANEAVKIVEQFIGQSGSATGAPAAGGAAGGGASGQSAVLNLTKVISGQQVMLRVRVGEIHRTALKNLGVNLSLLRNGSAQILGGSQGGIGRFESTTASGNTGFGPAASLGPFTINGSDTGVLGGLYQAGNISLGGVLEALESNGLLKILAEPNLVAISGEKAEFLAGGEFPIPVSQPGGGTNITTVQFKSYGVAVQFIPYVLSDNRIRIAVEPEVSAIDNSQAVTTNGTTIPALSTRRAKTTVELAQGESFMIAGLISDQLNSTISQVPGASEIPILGALLRSTSYQRNETELVIAVTPYIVDPVKSSDVRLPTDDFRPASVMEQFFYGALGAMSGNTYRISQTPSLEGPIGFMTD